MTSNASNEADVFREWFAKQTFNPPMVSCFYCGYAHEEAPFPHACPNCTVELNTLIEPGDTLMIGDLIEQFKTKYGFDPAEMFPRFHEADPIAFADQSFRGYVFRMVRQDIESAEDARFLAALNATSKT